RGPFRMEAAHSRGELTAILHVQQHPGNETSYAVDVSWNRRELGYRGTRGVRDGCHATFVEQFAHELDAIPEVGPRQVGRVAKIGGLTHASRANCSSWSLVRTHYNDVTSERQRGKSRCIAPRRGSTGFPTAAIHPRADRDGHGLEWSRRWLSCVISFETNSCI